MANSPQDPRRVVFRSEHGRVSTPELDALVLDVLGRVADKWTMCVLEVLEQNGVLRFTRVGELVGSISQRMLTKTLRQMEADGLVVRTVHPEVPPRVEYTLTELGSSLCAAFCSVWEWAEKHEPELRALREKAHEREHEPSLE
ncbi:winged helix-turn-helix transcriptional regulator [Pararobbsia silviterrae]|uniref:Transcriptional regulator n=1 Tax=Pararobbsia silviterrae TaxID=1792498 RepID=A0A494Y081_9BURK|nr:helix-turn-helix domain-containing protein [Pararobbsia silviterrae]RKP53771.1 transcriptional regulator [Pararobbsia silviterrae]